MSSLVPPSPPNQLLSSSNNEYLTPEQIQKFKEGIEVVEIITPGGRICEPLRLQRDNGTSVVIKQVTDDSGKAGHEEDTIIAGQGFEFNISGGPPENTLGIPVMITFTPDAPTEPGAAPVYSQSISFDSRGRLTRLPPVLVPPINHSADGAQQPHIEAQASTKTTTTFSSRSPLASSTSTSTPPIFRPYLLNMIPRVSASPAPAITDEGESHTPSDNNARDLNTSTADAESASDITILVTPPSPKPPSRTTSHSEMITDEVDTIERAGARSLVNDSDRAPTEPAPEVTTTIMPPQPQARTSGSIPALNKMGRGLRHVSGTVGNPKKRSREDQGEDEDEASRPARRLRTEPIPSGSNSTGRNSRPARPTNETPRRSARIAAHSASAAQAASASGAVSVEPRCLGSARLGRVFKSIFKKKKRD